ncbi:DUF4386 family protein [Agromyces bauzanensis]|uniref:DUF4386 family protein n=1 Tax=Agromyces bauzanensis TaxID=1308924 RepID=UPI001666F28B|nr:DUF4386 family protein [Agromyces bauzanensis]
MTVEARTMEPVGTGWRGLVRLGAAAAVFVVVMIPLQAAVFILSPPPSTVEGFFALFQDNPLLGLLDLDLLLTLDYLVMIPFYLALYVVVRRVAPAWGLLALVFGLFSVVLLVVSREATFSMWMLSNEYAAATSATDKAALLAAGTTLLTLYNGGTFATSYILGAISTLLFSAMMVRHHIFGRLPGLVGILTGLTMLVPANAGPVGLTIAMVSLLPTAVWLILLIPHLLRVARETPTGQHDRPVAATTGGPDIDRRH